MKVNISDEMVHSPAHYTSGDIECITYLEDNLGAEVFSYFCEGNVKKYMHRWRQKGELQDLEKAQWYLQRLISCVDKF
jgi:hypothetical protein